MELGPDTCHKENEPPRPAAPLRPEQWRLLRHQGVCLGSEHVPWMPMHEAKRGEPATTPSPGLVLLQGPCRVQTNLTSPGPHLGRVLKDTTGRLVSSGFQQQSNLKPLTWRPQRKAGEFAVQQCNLSLSDTTSPCQGPLACLSPSQRQSQPLTRDTPYLNTAGLAPLDGHTRPGPSSSGGLRGWSSRLLGEPLTLEDLAVPAQSQARSQSHAAIHQLLASVRCLEHEATRLRCRVSQEPPGTVQRNPWTSDGWILPTHPQPNQPILASWDERKRRSRDLRKATDLLGAQRVWTALSDGQTYSKPASPPETIMGTLTRGLLDNEQGVLPAQPPGPRDNRTPGPNYGGEQQGDHSLPGGTGSREGRLHPPAFSRAAQHGLPGRGEEGSPREQASGEEKREASCLPEAARVRSVHQNKSRNTVTVESKATCRQLLSRCLRAWRHLVQRQRAVALALALGRRRLLRKGFRALRWALQLREAWQEAAWGRHTKALLSRSFRKWKSLAVQQKQGQPYSQAVAGPPPSRGGQDQGPFLGRKAVVDPTWRSRPWCMGWHRVLAPRFSLDNFTPSPGNLEEEEEEEAWRILSYPGRRPESEDRRLQILQALQQLAVFLLRCHQKEQAMPERGLPREATGRTQSMEKPPQAWRPHATDMAQVVPLDSEHQRVWLCRCFGAWQQFMQRWARYRDHLANCQAGTLRTCLRQWVQMKQLRASDGAKVTQLSLHWQKAANLVLRSSAPEATAASHHRMLAQTQGLPQPQSSLQESCQKLAFLRVLLLWRTRLSLHQRANSLVQGTRKRMMRHIVRQWRLRVWGPASPSGKAHASLALEPLGSIPAGDGSLEKHPPHLEPLDNNPRDPERNGCPLGPGSEMQDCTGPVAVAADAVVGGDTVDPGAGPGTGMRCPTRLALPLATVSLALGQWFLREKYQKLVQRHLQGLQKEVFQAWQQAAACQRHMAQPEQLLLQRVLEAWVQLVAQGRVQRAAITLLQQAGPRHLLQIHWAQWQVALLRVRLELQAEAQEAGTVHPRPWAALRRWPRLASTGHLLLLLDTLGPRKQCLLQMPSPAPPTAGPGGHCDSGDRAPKGQCETSWKRLGGKYLHSWRLEVLLRRLRASQQARRLAATWQCWVDALGTEQLARTLLRQWRLGWTWRLWRRQVLRLQVVQRLQQREDSWALYQAFEKWHQSLAARVQKRGATIRPDTRSPGSRLDTARVPRRGGLGAPAAAVTFPTE